MKLIRSIQHTAVYNSHTAYYLQYIKAAAIAAAVVTERITCCGYRYYLLTCYGWLCVGMEGEIVPGKLASFPPKSFVQTFG